MIRLRSTSSRRRWLLSASIAFSFVIAEIVARRFVSGPVEFVVESTDPELLQVLRPGTFDSDGYYLKIAPHRIRITSYGCRQGSERAVDEAVRKRGTLFLGDSMTFGWGVSDHDAYPDLVGRLLGDTLPRPVAIHNCAVPGYNLSQIVRAAEHYGPLLEPSVMVVPINGVNDLQHPDDLTRFGPGSSPTRWIVRHSRLARFLYIVQSPVLWRRRRPRSSFLTRQEVEAAVVRLKAAAELSRSRLVFVQILEVKSSLLSADDMRELLGKHGFFWHQLTAFDPRDTRYHLARDHHWNPAGHRLVAARMAEILQAEMRSALSTASNPLP